MQNEIILNSESLNANPVGVKEALESGNVCLSPEDKVEGKALSLVIRANIGLLIDETDEQTLLDKNQLMLDLLGSGNEEVQEQVMHLIEEDLDNNVLDCIYFHDQDINLFYSMSSNEEFQILSKKRIGSAINSFLQIASQHPNSETRESAYYNAVRYFRETVLSSKVELEIPNRINAFFDVLESVVIPEKVKFIKQYTSLVYSITDEAQRAELKEIKIHPSDVIQEFVKEPENLGLSVYILGHLRYAEELKGSDLARSDIVSIDTLFNLLSEERPHESTRKEFLIGLHWLQIRAIKSGDYKLAARILEILFDHAGYRKADKE